MLDDLLGRTSLKEEISALEAQIESLERQLDAEQERRADAATARQEAERQVNRLQDRVAELEDRVERLQDEDESLAVRGEATLSGQRLSEVLKRLESLETGPEGALSAFVADGSTLSPDVRETFGEAAGILARKAPCLALGDDAGLVRVALRPPIQPDPFERWGEWFDFDREWFLPRGRYTLALVRSDLFAMGVYQGETRRAFHGFDSTLKSQHSKGGFSQARFERLRDEQIDDHLERCLEALEEREGERTIVVGERSVLGEVAHLADVTSTVDATGDPERALESAWNDFWQTRLWAL